MYDKLKAFDKKCTNWQGLWWHPEYNGFSSANINLAQLKEFKGNVKLYVRKNKYFNNGENGRPNYCFCFKDADSETFQELEVMDDDYKTELEEKIEELAEIMRDGNRNGDLMMLPSDSQSCANNLMRRAIDLIEEITGERWEFSYITW